MHFITYLNHELEKWSLLNNRFYQAWNEGTLTRAVLGQYAKEYYHHVAAFPRYISQIHTLCDDIQSRQVLLENLIDEEQGEHNHPELWLRFVEGLGCSRVMHPNPELPSTQALVNGFFELTKKDFPTGLGALYAYERQTPMVAKSKIEGLRQFYDIHDTRTLEFFVVHQQADEWHTDELTKLISKLDPPQQGQVYHGAIEGAKLLWGFLEGMMDYHLAA